MVTLLTGDCRAVLPTLAASSINCCVTSPPYWGLRDYGTAKWDGGDAACKHEPPQKWIDHNFNAASGFGAGAKTQSAAAKSRWYNADGSCRCGARRVDSQIGLESTPEAYVAEMVAVFREVRRVLRDDGTLWLNLGDSYAADTKGSSGVGDKQTSNRGTLLADRKWAVPDGLKRKDLIGIPWRVAFALQADGWYLRQDIIWHKPNPMPESVTDRCTKAHEYIFLFAKSARYYYDAEAIKEQAVCGWNDSEFNTGKTAEHQLLRSQKVRPSKPKGSFNCKTEAMAGTGQNAFRAVTETRNKRSVWTVATHPYKEAHFATFPPALITPCILAGCPVGGTVLDPFGGSGTTGEVAESLGRNSVLIELNDDYVKLQKKRTAQGGLQIGIQEGA